MSYAKQKGKELEDYVADQIVSKGIDQRARRDGASGAGTREKGDIQTSMMILNQNAGIECKNHKTIHIKEWWNQTRKLESLGREPMLIYKIQGQPMEETLVTMYLDTVLDLIKSYQKPKTAPQSTETTYTDNTIKYKSQRVINELKELIKILEKDD
jgi:hypothetical protein